MEFPTIPNSLELSRDGAILTVAHGKIIFILIFIVNVKVSLLDCYLFGLKRKQTWQLPF